MWKCQRLKMAKILNKEPAVYKKEQDNFLRELRKFHDSKGWVLEQCDLLSTGLGLSEVCRVECSLSSRLQADLLHVSQSEWCLVTGTPTIQNYSLCWKSVDRIDLNYSFQDQLQTSSIHQWKRDRLVLALLARHSPGRLGEGKNLLTIHWEQDQDRGHPITIATLRLYWNISHISSHDNEPWLHILIIDKIRGRISTLYHFHHLKEM